MRALWHARIAARPTSSPAGVLSPVLVPREDGHDEAEQLGEAEARVHRAVVAVRLHGSREQQHENDAVDVVGDVEDTRRQGLGLGVSVLGGHLVAQRQVARHEEAATAQKEK